MGRTFIVEDGIEEYGTALVAKKQLVVGLIFGQEISAQKSCVIHLSRSPEISDEELGENDDDAQCKAKGKVNESSSFGDHEEKLILDHARQVIRTLPGGITILGLFVVSSSDPFLNPPVVTKLRKCLTSIDKIIGKSYITVRHQLTCERAVLHICNQSNKYTCKTLDIASPIASPRPADWKFCNAAGSPWIELHCTFNVEMFACVSDLDSEVSLRQQVESALELYNKSVRQCLCLIDGKLLPESQLLDAPAEKESGKKKSKQTSTEERLKTWNIQILIPEPEMRSEKQKCVTELRFGGQMCIKGYVHSKATVGEACQVIKEDVIRSLWARCDMHCDSLIGEEQRGQPDVRPVLHEPPRRVLAPLPYSPISVSDYLFPGEGPADSLISLADLLDLGGLLEGDIQDYWEAAAEINEVLDAEVPETISNVQNSTQTASSNSRFILLSAIIALLAILLSYLTLHALRTT